MKKLSAITCEIQKNSLITKLLRNVNFVIFNKKVFFQFLNIDARFWKNHKTTGFNFFWLEYILKNLLASVLIKFVMYSDMQENFLY